MIDHLLTIKYNNSILRPFDFAFKKGFLGENEIAQCKCCGENERQGYKLSHTISFLFLSETVS